MAEPTSFIGGNHVIGTVAHHMKTLSVTFEVERQFGYSPEPPKWWQAANAVDKAEPSDFDPASEGTSK